MELLYLGGPALGHPLARSSSIFDRSTSPRLPRFCLRRRRCRIVDAMHWFLPSLKLIKLTPVAFAIAFAYRPQRHAVYYSDTRRTRVSSGGRSRRERAWIHDRARFRVKKGQREREEKKKGSRESRGKIVDSIPRRCM